MSRFLHIVVLLLCASFTQGIVQTRSESEKRLMEAVNQRAYSFWEKVDGLAKDMNLYAHRSAYNAAEQELSKLPKEAKMDEARELIASALKKLRIVDEILMIESAKLSQLSATEEDILEHAGEGQNTQSGIGYIASAVRSFLSGGDDDATISKLIETQQAGIMPVVNEEIQGTKQVVSFITEAKSALYKADNIQLDHGRNAMNERIKAMSQAIAALHTIADDDRMAAVELMSMSAISMIQGLGKVKPHDPSKSPGKDL